MIFKMASIGGNVTQQIMCEIDLFRSMILQNVIKNNFNSEYAPMSTNQLGVAIQFRVNGANNL